MHDDDAADVLEQHRRHLTAAAYRLTGSWVDAEDAVAEAWTRWRRHAGTVADPRAWLTTVVCRIALDQLRSARARRERYVGPYLPEPLVLTAGGTVTGARPAAGGDPLEELVVAEDVRMAFLVVLDAMTPEQRVAVVLHDALAVPFPEVAEVLGCSTDAARQHASRGRRRLARADLPRPDPQERAAAVLTELTQALRSGDRDRVAELLAPDVVLVSDGGGVVSAARRPLRGAREVGAFLLGLVARLGDRTRTTPAVVNGEPGLLAVVDSDRPQDPRVSAYAFTVVDGRVRAVHAVLAPEKVSHLPGSPYPRPVRAPAGSTPPRS
ncbi:RNA polymerase sigma factor SigJ [Thalassiella azotivora]